MKFITFQLIFDAAIIGHVVGFSYCLWLASKTLALQNKLLDNYKERLDIQGNSLFELTKSRREEKSK